MWKVTRKGLAGHKLRFLLTALAVVLGVSFIAGTLVLTATIQKTFDDLFADINRGTDAAVRSSNVIKGNFGNDQRANVPASLVAVVKQTPTVEDAVGNIQPYAQAVDNNDKAIGGNGPPTFGLGWDPNPKLNQFHLVSGHAPQADDEIVVDKQTADKGHFHVGQQVTILTTKAPRKYVLAGIAKFGTVDSLAGASIILFTPAEVQRVAGVNNEFSQISVVAKPGVSQTQVAQDIQHTLTTADPAHAGQYQVITGKALTKENQDAVHKALGFISTALLVFAFVALIVGMFIIYNTFSIVVAQRMREMALLRAIGASKRQVLASVIGESVVVGVLASAVGVIAGIGLSIGLKAVMNAVGFQIPGSGVVLRPSAVIIGLLVGTIVTIISAVVPARQAARVPPIAAMRAVALERPINRFRRLVIGGLILAVGILSLFAGLFGNSGISLVGIGALLMLVGVFVVSPLFARQLARTIGVPLTRLRGIVGSMARENAARNPRRTATTGAAVMIAVSLVGFITIFAASANASIGSAIDQQLKTDYIVTLKGGGGPGGGGLSPVLAEKIKALPQIEAATPIRLGSAEITGNNTFLAAADPATVGQLYDFGVQSGTIAALASPNAIAVSTRKADSKHLKVGSVLPARFVQTGNVPLNVAFIYKNNTLAGDYIISLATFEKNFPPQLQLDSQIFAKLKPGVSTAAGRAAIAPLVKPYPNADLKDNAQYKADQKKQVNQVLVLVYVLLFLAVIIAFIGIVNTMTLSIYERTREIGLLRAVGGSRRQVRSMVRWEAVIIALFGTLLGIALALFFGWAVVDALHDQGFTKFSAAPLSLVIIVVITGVATLGWASLPARRAARLDVLKAVGQE
jgi:putative ABC transport system permease protein